MTLIATPTNRVVLIYIQASIAGRFETVTNLSILARWSSLAGMAAGVLFPIGVALHPFSLNSRDMFPKHIHTIRHMIVENLCRYSLDGGLHTVEPASVYGARKETQAKVVQLYR
jgi:hypothetical protein